MFTVSSLSQFLPVTHFYGSHAIQVQTSDRGRQRFIVSDRDGADHVFDFLHDAEVFCDALDDGPRPYTVAKIAVNDWDIFTLVYDPTDPDHYRQDDSNLFELEELTLEDIVKMPLVDANLSVDSMQWLTEEIGSFGTFADDDGEEVTIDILDRAVLVR